MNAWLTLILAGLFEIGWPLGLKLANKPGMALAGGGIAIASMAASGGLLWLALREIPIGTAYAVWTGIGAAGTFIVGVYVFNDPARWVQFAGVAAIVGGVLMLKLGSGSA